jgi:hypothetical protein
LIDLLREIVCVVALVDKEIHLSVDRTVRLKVLVGKEYR